MLLLQTKIKNYVQQAWHVKTMPESETRRNIKCKGEKKKSKHMYFIRVVKFVVLKPCSNFAKIFQNSPQNNMCIKIMIFMTSSSKTSFTFPQAFLTLL